MIEYFSKSLHFQSIGEDKYVNMFVVRPFPIVQYRYIWKTGRLIKPHKFGYLVIMYPKPFDKCSRLNTCDKYFVRHKAFMADYKSRTSSQPHCSEEI